MDTIFNLKKTLQKGLLLVIPFVLFSCVNTKKYNTAWLYKNQIVYESKVNKKGNTIILRDSVIEPCIVKIVKRDSTVSLVLIEGDFQKDTLKISKNEVLPKGIFFPYLDTVSNSKSKFVQSEKLRYLEASAVFQAITIPLKVRFAEESLPYTASGSINIGFAWGWKFTHNVYKNYHYRKTKLFMNSETNSFTVTPGIFAGPTIIEITRVNSSLLNDRDVLGLTSGVMLVFGINRFNIGLATGVDYVIGNSNKSWVYDGVPWLGLTIALDFIK